MKRYKLLKDLPTLKAGSEFELSDFGSLCYCKDDTILITVYSASTLEKFPEILESGEWFEEIEDDEKPWEPKNGEQYFYINPAGQYLDGKTHFLASFHDDDEKDLARLSIGNYFRTREDADMAVEKLKALKRLRDKGFAFEHWNYLDDENDEGKVEIKIRAVLDYDAIHDHAVREDLDSLFEEEDERY